MFELFCKLVLCYTKKVMNRLFTFGFVILLTSFSLIAQKDRKQPKLVVGVVVDQMRHEYLYRFYDHFGDDGFKRLMSDGFEFKNVHFNYVPTYTAPGHASVYTGTTPRVHGIISNDWYDKYAKEETYCVGDNRYVGIGASGELGNRSPYNLKTSTITDELRLHYQNRAKVVGISMKDRGAILPSGHDPTGAYWFDPASGNYMSSTFYKDELPEWVSDFNARKLAEKYMDQTWETYYNINDYVESAEDNRACEISLNSDKSPVFPYNLKKISKKEGAGNVIAGTPFGNSILTDLAFAAIDGEQLGMDDVPDFLSVSYSSTDYIGHAYGPYSKEIQDTYVRLDLELARLMKTLDEKIGEGNWTMFLTADHAVADTPMYIKEKKQDVDYFSTSKVEKDLSISLNEKFGSENLIEDFSNFQVFLNNDEIKKLKIDIKELKEFVIVELKTKRGVSGVYDVLELRGYGSDHLDVQMLTAGLNSYLSGDIALSVNPGWLGDWSEKGGSSHGSGYSYDTHVPLLFYGWGIKQGSTVTYHPITDIAPSIAMLLNIKYPSGTTGQPAVELWEK
jgi:predicted AlkP superfamily pyrophosphatase or phosphodiesterase